MTTEQAINPIPPVVLGLAVFIFGIELVFSAAEAGMIGGPMGIGWRAQAMQDYGFQPTILDWMITRRDYAPELLKRFVTYAFVQPDFFGSLFASAMILALGKFVGDVFSATATLAVFLLSVVMGAVVFGLILGDRAFLIGAFPGIYGLIGAFTYILWLRLGEMGQNQLQAFKMIGFLLALQLLYGLIFGAGVMWVAELAGFATGFASSTLLAPGGAAALMSRLRQRS